MSQDPKKLAWDSYKNMSAEDMVKEAESYGIKLSPEAAEMAKMMMTDHDDIVREVFVMLITILDKGALEADKKEDMQQANMAVTANAVACYSALRSAVEFLEHFIFDKIKIPKEMVELYHTGQKGIAKEIAQRLMLEMGLLGRLEKLKKNGRDKGVPQA